MATEKHYLFLDDIIVVCSDETFYYHTMGDAKSLKDVWKREVNIVDPDLASHKFSGFIPDNWEVEEVADKGASPVQGFRYPKYRGEMNDDSVWDHLISYTTGKDYPSCIRVYRTVYELEGGEMPILYSTIKEDW